MVKKKKEPFKKKLDRKFKKEIFEAMYRAFSCLPVQKRKSRSYQIVAKR
ncbi:hypothetical protein [Kurthia senegalensis]|nr:hypothetical protein [Kurthia senegalensis]